jgi:hypothetical protein
MAITKIHFASSGSVSTFAAIRRASSPRLDSAEKVVPHILVERH